ncbi:hypothetical protein ACFU6K_06520 [Kitasatospora sp. NPDC057512]|uniref:hypothetical protein n=1 Tax=Kitasatospora sp. NPDC057512 TaxID=3346154 RepID=UPI0036CE6EB7
MKPFSVQRLGAILAAILALGVILTAQPASAAVNGARFSVSRSTAAPGDRLTLTMSLTNTEDSDIYFAYGSLQPTWPANLQDGSFTITGCPTNGVNNCYVNGNSVHFGFDVRIAPGETRTATFTVQIAPNLTLTTPFTLNWAPYVYYEYGSSRDFNKDQFWGYGLPELRTVIG